MLKALRHIFFVLAICISSDALSQSVYKTPSGKKYHLATCRMVKNVSKQITLQEATKLGLGPCSICKPPSAASNASVDNLKSTTKAQGTAKGVQCKGITKAGKRCKHLTKIANGYCFQHQPKK